MSQQTLTGNIVDVVAGRIFSGRLHIDQGCIVEVREEASRTGPFIIPGLIDSHVHIESSMLPPAEFARLATVHGSVAAVADPHEIANVLGTAGINYMLDNARLTPFTFLFGAPACVPATPFETAGGSLAVAEIKELLATGQAGYLSEVMNFPAVLAGEAEVMAKISAARWLGRVIDGHAPGLTGEAALRYGAAGITTDHECSSIGEALDKINAGMHILIREGSAARNFDDLAPLIASHGEEVMFCSDDLHPDQLVKGHINRLVSRAINQGYDPIKVLRCATSNPVRHYGLQCGLLQPGDRADLAVVDDLATMRVIKTLVAGELCAENGRPLLRHTKAITLNHFAAREIKQEELQVAARPGKLRVIKAMDGQLLTACSLMEPKVEDGTVVGDRDRDILKLVVLNRYQPAPPALAFVKGFGLRNGALASTVAHDSHNIIAVGVDDQSLCRAINLLVGRGGGICAVGDAGESLLPLPIAGLMAVEEGYQVARRYSELDARAKQLGSPLAAPFMTLSFMALLVIPSLKLSDRGLFDSETFRFVNLFADSTAALP